MIFSASVTGMLGEIIIGWRVIQSFTSIFGFLIIRL
jgi:hypothetical protein